MALRVVKSYNSLKRKDKGEKQFRNYFPLRAVGLALESGYKLCKEGALWLVEEDDLNQVRVSGGTLQALVGNSWKTEPAVFLCLRSQDAALALKLLRKQHDLLSDLDFNWFSTDKTDGGDKSLDLSGYFTTKRNAGVLGRVWVEVKTFGKKTFKKEAEKARTVLRAEFASLKRRDSRYGGVMLLAAVCEVVGNEWGCPVLKPELLTSEGGEWQKLAGKQSVARGQSRSNATFLQVWGGMAKHTKSEDGAKVRMLKGFLLGLELPREDTTQKMTTYNKLLRLAGCSERLEQKRVVQCSGKAPVVGTKSVFRELYKLLRR